MMRLTMAFWVMACAAFTVVAADKDAVWGKKLDGAVASLRALKAEVKPGEAMEFELRVKNVSGDKVRSLTGRGGERMSPCTWKFQFGEWTWEPPGLSYAMVPLKRGETVGVRCLVAPKREELNAEQRRRFLPAKFRHRKTGAELAHLPAGTYRVQGWSYNGRGRAKLWTNPIEIRIQGEKDGR